MPWMSLLWLVELLEWIKREQETVVVMLPATRWLPSDGAVTTTETTVVHFNNHHCRAHLITQTMEVFDQPTIPGGAIEEFASKVTSKTFLDRFYKILNLVWVFYQVWCLFYWIRSIKLIFPLNFLLLAHLLIYCLQLILHRLHSLLQLWDLTLES